MVSGLLEAGIFNVASLIGELGMWNQLWNVPNMVTVLRGVFGLVALYLWHKESDPSVVLDVFSYQQTGFLLGVFVVSTDGIDGILARYLKQETAFGAMLDPLVDKFNFYLFVFGAFLSSVNMWILVPLAVADMLSTIERHKNGGGALFWGKGKTVLGGGSLGMFGVYGVHWGESLLWVSLVDWGNLLLFLSFGFAAVSITKRTGLVAIERLIVFTMHGYALWQFLIFQFVLGIAFLGGGFILTIHVKGGED